MDRVKHPSHYASGKIECIDYIRDKLSSEGFVAYCIGNVIKYVTRFDKKGEPNVDLAKAKTYLEWAIEETLTVGTIAIDVDEQRFTNSRDHSKTESNEGKQ